MAVETPLIEIIASPENTTSVYEKFAGNITLTEISFKNKEHDYLKFIVKGESDRINLQNIAFFDDKVFKTIEDPFFVHSGEEITLIFNSTEQDDEATNTLHTTKKGLTATTEQILIKYHTESLAFFCWIKSPPSKAENESFPNIVPINLWEDPNIESCFDSESVKTNQVIKKLFEENNSSAWEIFQDKTANSENSTTKAENLGELIESAPLQTSGYPELKITEIYPMPQKEEIEWVEIFNPNPNPINLNNWIIDDSEGGSKPKRLSSIIIPGTQTTLVNLKELKINLNNDTDSIRVFTPEGIEVASQEYSGGKKGESYSLISIDGEENWQWTGSPTPGKTNPHLETVKITITTAPVFEDIYYFMGTLKNEEGNETKAIITFSEDIIKAPTAKEIFKANTVIKIIGEIFSLPENTNKYNYKIVLYDFEIIGDDNKDLTIYLWCIFLLVPGGACVYYFITKSNIVNTEKLI